MPQQFHQVPRDRVSLGQNTLWQMGDVTARFLFLIQPFLNGLSIHFLIFRLPHNC
jgi:hypothetical protein